MSDPLERAIDEMADELAAMGKAMSRDSKRIEKLEVENQRLREEVESNCMAANFWWREAYRANKQELPRPSKEKDRECLKRIAELESAEAERDELREALSHIRDFPWSASNVQAVARQALWQAKGGVE